MPQSDIVIALSPLVVWAGILLNGFGQFSCAFFLCLRKDTLLNPLHLGMEFDAIVSNPPYICQKEKVDMEANVVDHEPSIALFVPDSDPLMFYRAITRYASTSLNKGGCLFFEINPLYAKEMETMAEEEGFAHFETREDQYGKKRMMKIWKE